MVYWMVMGLGLGAFLSALGAMGFLAGQMRLSGDDYCYRAVLAREGFWGMQLESYRAVTMYNGNRFSLTLFAGLAGLLPPWGNGLMVILALTGWVAALYGAVRTLAQGLRIVLSPLEGLWLAAGFAVLVLWGAPNPTQSIYWLSGMLPYFMPLVGGTLLFGWGVRVALSDRWEWLSLAGIFALACLTGGFSETGAALQGGFWGLVLVGALVGVWDRRLTGPALAASLGSLGAVTLLLASPSASGRLAEMPGRGGVGEMLSLLGLNLKVYFWILLRRRTETVLLPLLLGIGLGWFSFVRGRNPPVKQGKGGQRLVWLAGLGGAAVFLVFCVLLPGTVVFVDYPPERALILSQAVVAGTGWVGGVLLSRLAGVVLIKTGADARLWGRPIFGWVGVLLILVSLATPALSLARSWGDWRKISRWARLWDQRHRALEWAEERGEDTVHVMKLDHIIQDVGELAEDPDYWYNNCAEMWYGLDAIYADQPGW